MPTFFVLATVYKKRAATSAIYFKCLISNFMPERASCPFRFFILRNKFKNKADTRRYRLVLY